MQPSISGSGYGDGSGDGSGDGFGYGHGDDYCGVHADYVKEREADADIN